MKKHVEVESHAGKEFHTFNEDVRRSFLALIETLEEQGEIREPDGKKIKGYKNLYELRIRSGNQYRGLYAYYKHNMIVIVHFFQKKTQKILQKNIDIAIKRFKDY